MTTEDSKIVKWEQDLKYPIAKKLEKGESVFFISDLHLGDGTFTDLFDKKDQILIEFLEYVKNTGDKLVIIGDAMDFMQAWSFDRIIKAHREVLKKLKEVADTIEVYYVYGNHDDNIVLFRDILNFIVCDTLELGDDILVEHGHLYDIYKSGTNRLKFAIGFHNILERLTHTRIHVPLSDNNNFSNRLVHWFIYRLIQLTRLYASLLSLIGLANIADSLRRMTYTWYINATGGAEILFRAIKNKLKETKYNMIICGHSHKPGIVDLDGKKFINTGSWTHDNAYYGFWDGVEFKLRDYITKIEITNEEYRDILSRDRELTAEEWWKKYYKGYLRFKF